jgi:hypothetical protein
VIGMREEGLQEEVEEEEEDRIYTLVLTIPYPRVFKIGPLMGSLDPIPDTAYRILAHLTRTTTPPTLPPLPPLSHSHSRILPNPNPIPYLCPCLGP